MFTMLTENTRRVTSAVAAVAVVAFAGLGLDQGHVGALPQGTVEVGELTPVNLMQLAQVTLAGDRGHWRAGRARGAPRQDGPAQPSACPGGGGRQGRPGRSGGSGQGERSQGKCPAKVVL